MLPNIHELFSRLTIITLGIFKELVNINNWYQSWNIFPIIEKYKTSDDKFDCMQQGILMMFQNWNGFNEKKYSSAFPYFSEICKRGIAGGLNVIYQKKNNQESPRMISLSHSNEGKGLHNI